MVLTIYGYGTHQNNSDKTNTNILQCHVLSFLHIYHFNYIFTCLAKVMYVLMFNYNNIKVIFSLTEFSQKCCFLQLNVPLNITYLYANNLKCP